VQVLSGLGHDPFVGGNDQDDQIDPPHASQHRFDEPFVAGNIHNPEDDVIPKPQGGKAELDGNSSLLLLLEPVGVDAGEGLHQGGLAVIDVARGPDDDAFHGRIPSTSERPLPT
jgi:hypothetical protein